MKRNRIGFAMLLMMLAGNAQGADTAAPETSASVNVEDKAAQARDVQKALAVLARANVLMHDPISQKVEIRLDAIEQMRAEGLIKT